MLSSVPGTPSAPPRRRAFLALGPIALTATGLIGLTGCGGPGEPGATVSTPAAGNERERAAVERAVTAVRALQTGAADLASGTLPGGSTLRIPGATAKLLTRIADVHAAQLTKLGAPGATSTPTPSSSATDDSTTTIASPSALATAEWAAARATLRDAAGLTPGFALLLYRIAAAGAANADLLRDALGKPALGVLKPAPPDDTNATSPTDGTTTPTSPPPDETETPASPPASMVLTGDETTSLNRLLAGEHAAFYAYPLVIAHSGSRRRAIAQTLWEAHRQQRDELERFLVAAGAEPAEAAGAYQVTTPATAANAAALATLLEKRLAGLAADVIAGSTNTPVVALAAGSLIADTRRQAAWGNRPVADPGSE